MKQRELSKSGNWFLNFMNNKGGAQFFVIFGIMALILLVGPFFVQSYNILSSDLNITSIAIVIFGVICVLISLIALIILLTKVGKDFFKNL